MEPLLSVCVYVCVRLQQAQFYHVREGDRDFLQNRLQGSPRLLFILDLIYESLIVLRVLLVSELNSLLFSLAVEEALDSLRLLLDVAQLPLEVD